VRLEDWQWRAEDEGRMVYLVEVVKEWIGRLVGGTGWILRYVKRGLLLLGVFVVLLGLQLQRVRLTRFEGCSGGGVYFAIGGLRSQCPVVRSPGLPEWKRNRWMSLWQMVEWFDLVKRMN
jgi:hypothetical protein